MADCIATSLNGYGISRRMGVPRMMPRRSSTDLGSTRETRCDLREWLRRRLTPSAGPTGSTRNSQSVHVADHDRLSRQHTPVADIASQISPWTKTLPRGESGGLRDANFSHQSLRAGHHFVGPRLQGDAHQEDRDRSQRNAHRQRGQQMHPHLRNGRVHQQQSAQNHGDHSADRQNPMRGKLRLQREQRKRREDQHHGRESHRQKIQRENRQQNKNHSHRSRHHRPGMVELGIERQRSDRQKNECDVGIHDEGQDPLLQRHVEHAESFRPPDSA